ncbi:uncharacterized protein LOC135476782 isoform X2 [Liolophura sinensis]|uniref:uncharacterized protein LOC135476782 isoform X2 n=1 Tax=Liolophura sinensis TaxID=3198878 RepID=UPI0031595D55
MVSTETNLTRVISITRERSNFHLRQPCFAFYPYKREVQVKRHHFSIPWPKYEMLSKLLTGEPVVTHRERYVKLVELLTSVIITNMNPVALLPHLVQEACLNDRDKQNIECTAREQGYIEATELLLSRVTRLKDDWFRGFMTALQRVGVIGLMKEIDPDYAEKMLAGPEQSCDVPELSTELSALDLDQTEANLTDTASTISADVFSTCKDSEEDTLDSTSSDSSIILREYQREWFESLSTGQNTFLMGPRKSGKTVAALKFIQEHLSSVGTSRGKVVYICRGEARMPHLEKQCNTFLTNVTTTVIQGSRSVSRSLDEILQHCSLAIMIGETFHNALRERTAGFGDFSLVILELGEDYFVQDRHVYKKIMPFFQKLKACSESGTSQPQILVLSASFCESRSGWPLRDTFGVAMETCAEFDAKNTALVETSMGSLRKFVAIPLVEHTPVMERRNKEFSDIIEELMFA